MMSPYVFIGLKNMDTPQERLRGPLTAREVADLLVVFADPPVTIERLKHWSRRKLIASFERHPGTGRHRQYDIGVLIDAAVLSELTDVGLQVVSLDYVPYALKHAREAAQTWLRARSRKETVSLFLLIERGSGKPENVRVVDTISTDPKLESLLIVNLARVFARIKWSLSQ
jgi:hypothetical protein